MSLQPRTNARERVLAIGGPGVGKSTGILHIARKIPTSQFYVLDTDFAFERMLTGDNEALHADNGGNVHVRVATEWADYTAAIPEYQQQMSRDDWLVIDMIGPAWDSVQEFYTDRVFGKDIDQFFLEARTSQKKGSAFDGRKDWGVINKLYKSWVLGVIGKTPGHIYATTGITALSEDDDRALRNLFGAYGVKPVGQKANAHMFHTVLLLSKGRVGEWRMTTVKDRERAEVENQPVTDFAIEYLLKIARWRPA